MHESMQNCTKARKTARKHAILRKSMQNCTKARKTVQKHTKLCKSTQNCANARKTTQNQAQACGSIKVFKCLVRPFQIFWLAVQKSVARFEGGGGGCVFKSDSTDSLLLSKIDEEKRSRGLLNRPSKWDMTSEHSNNSLAQITRKYWFWKSNWPNQTPTQEVEHSTDLLAWLYRKWIVTEKKSARICEFN